MKPPCLNCCIHKDKEDKKYNVFCLYHCHARIRYASYIDRSLQYSYYAVDQSGDTVYARGIAQVDDNQLSQDAYI
jgi:hypothetical protein